MWKILSGVAALFLLLSAIFAYLNYTALQTETVLADRAASNLAAAQEHKEVASTKLADTKVELAKTEGERDEAQTQLADAKTKLEDMTSKLEQAETLLASKTEEVNKWETELDKLGDLKTLQTQLASLETQIAEHNETVATLKSQQSVKLAEKQQSDGQIDSYKTLVANQSAGRMPSIQTSVRSISPDWGFIVINAGNNRGVVNKAKLDVIRGGSVVGSAVVAIVEPNLAVANVISMDPTNAIQPGDSVSVAAESKAAPRS